jgi:hypothetical protein
MKVKVETVDTSDTSLKGVGEEVQTAIERLIKEAEDRHDTVAGVQVLPANARYSAYGKPGDYREYWHSEPGFLVIVTSREGDE